MVQEQARSDVDLAIFTFNSEDISEISALDLNALLTPCVLYIVDYQRVALLSHRDHPDRLEKVLFSR